MRRVSFVGDMGCKDASGWSQYAFGSHPVGVLDELDCVQMVRAGFVGAVRMIENYQIKAHVALAKHLPRLVEQCGGIRAIKDGAAGGFDGIKHRPHPWCVVRRKCSDRIRTRAERLKRLDPVRPEIEFLLRFRRQKVEIRKISAEGFGSVIEGLTRGIKLEDGRAHYAISRAAREDVGQIEMIGVWMCLQTISHLVQGRAVDLGRGHNVRAEINQQVVVHQSGGAFAEALAAERARLSAVWAGAKRFGEGVGGSGSKESEEHGDRRVSSRGSTP